ncbi:MAG: RDD family protein [Bacteroidia bacterium]|nr:RDD family protein [Bacteroidia bacterium]
MHTIRIPTSHYIDLEYTVASLGGRTMAGFIDLLFMGGYFLLCSYLLSWTEASLLQDTEAGEAPFRLTHIGMLLTVPMMFYSLLCEQLLNGQTLGKKIMRIRTITLAGTAPDLAQACLRWALRMVDVWLLLIVPVSLGAFPIPLPGLVAFISVALSKQGQRLGDIAAGTTVIRLRQHTAFQETMFTEVDTTYQMVFPEIRHLSDKDVSILKNVLDNALQRKDPELMRRLAERIKQVTGIESTLPPDKFLDTVLKDYNHYYTT